MINQVIIFAGTSHGSVFALADQLKDINDLKISIITLNSEEKILNIYKSSKLIHEILNIEYVTNHEFFEKFKIWFEKKNIKGKPITFFTNDISCYLVDEYRIWFDSRFKLILPSSEIIRAYTQKGLAEVHAVKNGLICPKSKVISDKLDINEVENNFSFPVIIKPLSTYNLNKAPFKTKLIKQEEFNLELNNIINSGYQVICQEYIPGDDENAYFYLFNRNKKGVINFLSGNKSVQCPPRAGIMAKGIVKDVPELDKICKEFLTKIDYIGIGGIEFKKYKGIYYFIEMSTRLEGFFKISTIAEVPLGRIAFDNEDKVVTPQKNVVYVDLIALLTAYKKDKNYFKIIKDIFLYLVFKKNSLNIYNKIDKKPFTLQIKSKLFK